MNKMQGQMISQLQERVRAAREQVKARKTQVLGRFGVSGNPGIATDIVEKARSRIQTVTARARGLRPGLLEGVKAPASSSAGRAIAGSNRVGVIEAGRRIAGAE